MSTSACVRASILPASVAALAIGTSLWGLADPAALDALLAERSALYLQPWRALTSLLVHYSVPHLIFNVVTLGVLGLEVVRRYGGWWFAAAFLAASLVGQVTHTLLAPGYVYGISGGVSGLYGFLLRRRRFSGWRATLREWPMGWIYPLCLLGLLAADLAGALPVANLNHATGIVVGWLLGGESGTNRPRISTHVGAVAVAAALVLLAYRPWDPVWQAVHDRYPSSLVLPSSSCDAPPGPPEGGVSQQPGQLVTILNHTDGRLSLDYLTSQGELVAGLETSLRVRSFRPVLGSVWRVSDGSARCLQWFVASREGVVLVR